MDDITNIIGITGFVSLAASKRERLHLVIERLKSNSLLRYRNVRHIEVAGQMKKAVF